MVLVLIQLMDVNVLIVEIYQHRYGDMMLQIIIYVILVVYVIELIVQIDHYND
jgi:hypothetical protein